MKIIVSSTGKNVESPLSTVFGRAEHYLLVDSEDFSSESFDNPAFNQSSGAGIQAAQFALKQNPAAIISMSIGPNAYEVLSAGSVSCYTASEGSVLEAMEAFNRGELKMMGAANASSHSGMARKAEVTGKESGGKENELEQLTATLRDLRSQAADILLKLDKITEEKAQ